VSRLAIVGSRGYPSHYGGFETLVRHLAPYLAEQGHAVTVYGHSGGARTRTTEVSVGVGSAVTVRQTPGVDGKSTSTLTHGLTAFRDLTKGECDAALVLNVAHGFYLRQLAKAGIATCVNVDGVEWNRGKWGGVAQSAFWLGAHLTARYADALVLDSEALRPVWREQFGREGWYIPYGAPVLRGVGTCGLERKRIRPHQYVLVVARIVPENNIDLLLDACDLLEDRPQIVVVGDGNYQHPTVNRLRSLHTEGRVHWLGHINGDELLNELWAHAGVYWHGHSVGGTNPGLLQALGAGAPTLALDTPFNREVIVRDEQLMPGEPKDLAVAMSEVLGSAALAKQLSESGQEIIESRYSWSDVCRRYEDLLLSAADGGGAVDEVAAIRDRSTDNDVLHRDARVSSTGSRNSLSRNGTIGPVPEAPEGGAPLRVVVVNYGMSDVVVPLVQGLPEWTTPVVVDCFSTRAEQAKLCESLETGRVELIPLAGNRGFGGGANAGSVGSGNVGWTLFLNPDAKISEDDLLRLWRSAQEGDLDISSPTIVNPTDGRIWFSGGSVNRWGIVKQYGYGRPLVAQGDTSESTCSFVSGCIMLLSPRAVERVLPFREDLFMYWEDVDLSLKAKQAGLRMGVVRTAVGYHSKELSSSGSVELSTLFYRYAMRNRIVVGVEDSTIDTNRLLLATPLIVGAEIARVLLRQDQVMAKIRAILAGTIEGLFVGARHKIRRVGRRDRRDQRPLGSSTTSS
jgi:GT2 family glycosyltransferase/glycosyltransferase involved in cell wall biosynthesis